MANTAAVLKIASAIQDHEGWFPGSLSYRNNNPGNLRFAGQKGAVIGDGGFASFPTFTDGMAALQSQIQLDASRGLTLRSFLLKYAPASENDTAAYLASVQRSTGFNADDLLNDLAGSDPAADGSDTEPARLSMGTLVAVGAGAAGLLWLVTRG